MFQALSKWILYKLLGWKKEVTIRHSGKFIICLAPHTSNFDFILGQLYAKAEGMKINFLMKKEWFVGPLGVLLKRIGGIPVSRNRHTNMTDMLADTAMRESEFRLCITPEGTRSLNPEWRKGFYYIASKANIPILLYGLDYNKKLIQCTKSMTPSGDFDKDIDEIKNYFKGFTGRHPELFTTGN